MKEKQRLTPNLMAVRQKRRENKVGCLSGETQATFEVTLSAAFDDVVRHNRSVD